MTTLTTHNPSGSHFMHFATLRSLQGTCPGGYYRPNVDVAVCEPVGQGYYSPTDDIHRYLCHAGTFSSSLVAVECEECPPGSYSNFLENVECQFCPPGSYADVPGTALCGPCDPFYYGGYGSDYAIALNSPSNAAPGVEGDGGGTLFCLEPVVPVPQPNNPPPSPAPTGPTTEPPTFAFTPSVETPAVTAAPSSVPTWQPSAGESQTPTTTAPTLTPTELPPHSAPTDSVSFMPSNSFAPSVSPTTVWSEEMPATSSSSKNAHAIVWPLLISLMLAGLLAWACGFSKRIKTARTQCSRCFGRRKTPATATASAFSWNRHKPGPPNKGHRNGRKESFDTAEFPPHDPTWPTDDCFSVSSETQPTFNLHSAFTHDDNNSLVPTNQAFEDEISVTQPSVAGATSVWSVPAAADVVAASYNGNIVLGEDQDNRDDDNEEEDLFAAAAVEGNLFEDKRLELEAIAL